MDLKSILTAHYEAGPIKLMAWEVAYLIVMVLVLSFVLDRLLFRPVLGVLDARKKRLETAAAERDAALKGLETAARTHAEKIGAARREAMQALATAKAEGEGVRQQELDAARKTAEGRIQVAQEAVGKVARKAEHELRMSAGEMARKIASALLGRAVA